MHVVHHLRLNGFGLVFFFHTYISRLYPYLDRYLTWVGSLVDFELNFLFEMGSAGPPAVGAIMSPC